MGLEIGENFRCPLHFVNHCTIRCLSQKAPWIVDCQLPDIRVFQGKVRFPGEYGSGQGGFSGLTGAGYGNDGKALKLVLNYFFNITWNHMHK